MRRLWFMYKDNGQLSGLRVIDDEGDKSFSLAGLKEVFVTDVDTDKQKIKRVQLFFKTDWHTEYSDFGEPFLTDLRLKELKFDDVTLEDIQSEYDSWEEFFNEFRELFKEI